MSKLLREWFGQRIYMVSFVYFFIYILYLKDYDIKVKLVICSNIKEFEEKKRNGIFLSCIFISK